MESWLIAELDETALRKQVFPALVARDFPMTGDQNYRVAVVTIPSSVAVFSSGNAWTAQDLTTFDYAVDLIGGPGQFGQIGGIGRGGPPRPGGRGGGPQAGIFVGQGLRLLVKHEAGSLETAVSNLRRRNLAISFGILLVLGFGAGVGIVSGHRARTLGRLQMEFAAGVSHELRTPLAVIQSAAHNLRAGVVQDREGIEEYATIVQKEARRLSNMVEQVMTYAETQSGRKRYDIAPVDLNAVVDRALQNMALPLGDANASVENRIDPQLPPAMGDEVALTQCVQNLISNALKYGSGADSVQIEIESEVERSTGTIRLSVIDHGPGVPQVDERYLFDPFHRGANAATNTPGNGLGLHLVQRMMEAQGGSVTYRRAAGGGASFMLTLPVAKESV
jgi:signal transduction histidine kinase